MRTRRRTAWTALTGSTMRRNPWRWTSRGTRVSMPDITEQLDATDEHLARRQRASLNRSRASRRPRRSGRTSIRSLVPNTMKLRRQQPVSSCSRKTVHVKVKVTSSTPSATLTVQSQDPERGGHANRPAASDVAGKQLEDDRTVSGVQRPAGESLCRTCETRNEARAMSRAAQTRRYNKDS